MLTQGAARECARARRRHRQARRVQGLTVTSFGHARQNPINDQTETLHTRLGSFSAEHLRLVDTADQAYSAIKTGNIGLTGATGTLLTHTLSELRSLPERTLPEIRPARATAAPK